MTSLRTAAQQALEAMESAEVDPHSSDAIHSAITALRAALAEPSPQRKPLTETEAYAISDDFRSTYIHGGTMFDSFDALGFARAIERAHGIKE